MTTSANKTIHYIWYQGIDNIPAKFKKNIKDMYEYNKDTWQIKVWDDKDLYALASMYSPVLENIFYKLPHMHQRIDLGRYLILFFHAGLSMDTDVVCLKPLDTLDIWDQHRLIVGEINMNQMEKMILTKTLICPAVNNAVIYSRDPGNIVLKVILDKMIVACNADNNLVNTDTDSVLWTTGPTIFSQILCDDKLADKITILPAEIFEPITAVLNVNGITEHSVLAHFHEQSWVKRSKMQEFILSVYVHCREYINWGTVMTFLLVTILLFIAIRRLLDKKRRR